MKLEIDDLLDRLHRLEDEFENRLDEQRNAQDFTLEDGKATFTENTIRDQKKIKIGLIDFLIRARIIAILSAPVVYLLIVPFVFLDIMVTFYMVVCFTAWQLHLVRRSDYIIIDRQHLAYLNPIQKFHCVYCGYANGVIAYVQEVTARTEKFWCPIKHAARVKSAHAHYRRFMDYGDAEDYRDRLEEFRDTLRKAEYRRTKPKKSQGKKSAGKKAAARQEKGSNDA